MSIFKGSTELTDVKLGTTQIEKVYSGADLVWANEGEILFAMPHPVLNASQWFTISNGNPSVGVINDYFYVQNADINFAAIAQLVQGSLLTEFGKTYRVFSTAPIIAGLTLSVSVRSSTNAVLLTLVRSNGQTIDAQFTVSSGDGTSTLILTSNQDNTNFNRVEVYDLYVQEVL